MDLLSKTGSNPFAKLNPSHAMKISNLARERERKNAPRKTLNLHQEIDRDKLFRLSLGLHRCPMVDSWRLVFHRASNPDSDTRAGGPEVVTWAVVATVRVSEHAF